jgi:hypothetical protein
MKIDNESAEGIETCFEREELVDDDGRSLGVVVYRRRTLPQRVAEIPFHRERWRVPRSVLAFASVGLSAVLVWLGIQGVPQQREILTLNIKSEREQQKKTRLWGVRSSADEICRQIGQRRSEIIDLLAAAEPDLAAVRAKQEEILASRRRMQASVVGQLLSEKAALTAEQQQRLFDALRNQTGCDCGGSILVSARGRDGGIRQTLRTGG